jgi:hypothetical protein
MNNNLRLLAHALLGAVLGFFVSLVFLLLYYGTVYTVPVPDAVRFHDALWDTVMLSGVIFLVMFWRDIRVYIDKATPEEDDGKEHHEFKPGEYEAK